MVKWLRDTIEGGMGLTPGQGTKIPHTTDQKKKQKNKKLEVSCQDYGEKMRGSEHS